MRSGEARRVDSVPEAGEPVQWTGRRAAVTLPDRAARIEPCI